MFGSSESVARGMYGGDGMGWDGMLFYLSAGMYVRLSVGLSSVSVKGSRVMLP